MLHPALIVSKEAAISILIVDFYLCGSESLDCFVRLLSFEGKEHLFNIVEDALELIEANEIFMSFFMNWKGLLNLIILLNSRAHVVLGA